MFGIWEHMLYVRAPVQFLADFPLLNFGFRAQGVA